MAFGLKYHSGPVELVECIIAAGDGTATALGDAVKLAGSADVEGRPTVIQAAAGNSVFGVVHGVVPELESSLPYRAASTLRKVTVNICKDTVYTIQEDAVGGALAVTAVGQSADIAVAAIDTALGLSQMQLDSNTAAAGVATLKIIGIDPELDNLDDVGTKANFLVKISEHELGTAVTGV